MYQKSNQELYYLRLFFVFVSVYIAICLLYYFLQETLIFFPEKLQEDYRFDYEAEEINIQGEDFLLSGLLFESDKSDLLILYFHGNAGNLDGWGLVGKHFRELGYSTLITDYRGYGKSRGRLSEKNFYKDALRIYNYAREKFPDKKIILMGMSLGTGVAVDLASNVEFEKLILESPFHSLYGIAEMHFKYLPHRFILQYKFDSEKKIGRITQPILILHGTDDDIVPIESAERLKDSIHSQNFAFVKIESGGHNNLSTFPLYEEELVKFLER